MIYNVRFIFIVLNLLLSFLYSYTTLNFILKFNLPIYLALCISTFIELLILLDTQYFKKLTKIKNEKFYLFLITFSSIILFLKNFNYIVILIVYIFYNFFISYICLNYNLYIIDYFKSNRLGITDISIYSTLSKIIGFALGSIIYSISIKQFLLTSIVLFIIFYFFKIKIVSFNTKNNLIINKLKCKYLLFNIVMLSGTSVLWIPYFIKYLNDNNMNNLSFIVFILPGIVTILFLKIKDKLRKVSIDIILIIYIFAITLFLYFIYMNIYFSIIILLFSIITALGISITIELRTKFLDLNDSSNKKVIIQIFRVITPLFILLISLLGIVYSYVNYFILLFNVLSAISLLINKGKN